MTKKKLKKLDKEFAELKKLMKKYSEQHQPKYIPADEYWNNYHYWQDFSAPNFYLPKCCQGCPNNSINNPLGGGICLCTLPSQEMIKW